jgi:M6 family metalloprotease-like protein
VKKITFYITLTIVFLHTTLSLAQTPPKKGVTPPAYFWELQKEIQREYSNGYYADKFRERKQIREQISQGLLPESTLVKDTVYALTLMGQFTDLAGYYTQPQFQAQLYDGPNPTGTVTDYYTEVSYDQLYFTGDAQGWYNVLGNIQSYSPGTSSGGPKFVVELITDADPTLNFADYIQYYDAQNHPHIGFVAVVHAGAGAEAGANNIWSHRWNFTVYSGGPITTNDVDPVSGFNVIIDGPYAIMPERSGGINNSGPIIEIGVFCHEFGHVFGLPDLYDTDGSSEGIGEWGLMGSGSWGGNGSTPETPVHMSAWCKKELGWVTPVNITSYLGPLSVPNAEENPIVYRMWRDGTLTNQYFLIENRQKMGFDANIHESGFLIYHIDEAQSGNQNENHYLVDVEQADGLRNLNNNQGRGDAGDPFPGSTLNTRFDFGTNPNSQDYTLQNTFVSVRNIYKDGNMMVGDFEIGPRLGVYAFGDPLTSDFGDVEINTVSDTLEWIVTNFGTDDLVITDIASVAGPFIRTSNHNFSLTLSSYDSVTIKVIFAPTAVGDYDEVLSITCNDPGFTGIQLTGHSYQIMVPYTDIFYASCGSGNNGNIITIDRETGMGTTLGSSLYGEIRSLAVNPLNDVLYGLVGGATNSEIVKVNAANGESFTIFTLNIPVLSGIDFDNSGILYASHQNGDIYTIDLTNGNYTLVTTATIELNAIAFNPSTNQLWGAIRKTFGLGKDSVYTVDITTGEATPVGVTGFSVMTNDLAFDEDNKLFGVTGTSNTEGKFFEINQVNGSGSLIGTGVGFNHTVGIAFSINGPISSVNSDNEIIPEEFLLKQNYPNPFNPTTKIEFSLPVAADVQLIIYNILGQQVASLIKEQRSAGNYSIFWNADDSKGMKLSSGIYLYKLKATGSDGSEFQETRKMILLK